ncbi:ferrous iron transport protein B [Clostridiaceae bacterium HSG29]|nr:ferrous iron transport protein B [Clostridiaceae bacterium HSG29]
MSTCTIALAGNPNSGKTTLFNVLTGSNHSVGNWPGVTVEKKHGKVKLNKKIDVVDLPGTYSLTAYSMEERIARNYIVDDELDVVVNIVDGTNLERNLFLTSQIIELGKPVIIALNMMDEVEKNNERISIDKLSDELGIPVIGISALKADGIENLLEIVMEVYNNKDKYQPKPWKYSKEIENKISELFNKIEKLNLIDSKYPNRWMALKLIESDKEISEKINLRIDSRNEELEDKLVEEKYKRIGSIVNKCLETKRKFNEFTASDKIDRVLTNKLFGLPIFGMIMYLTFWLTFNVGGIFMDLLDGFVADVVQPIVGSFLIGVGAAEWLQSLIIDGIIGGVGGVLMFLPNIIFLFLAISLLEDTGYMARVAFILDKAMRKIGLSGKAFIPMIMGFGCNVPAIIATRTLENEKDRMIAILINPFMSCGARLPVYVLLSTAFFPGNEALVTFSLYILGFVMAIIMAFIFKKTLFKSEPSPFLMELPTYRMPSIKNVLLKLWLRVKDYITKAGTVIFVASVVVWFILGYNITGAVGINESFGAAIGKMISPIFKPLGFGNWQASLSLIAGLLAKEVVVSNMAIIYGLGDAVAEAALEGNASGFLPTLSAAFSQVSAYAFMVFILLYTPCVAVIGTIKRETKS